MTTWPIGSPALSKHIFITIVACLEDVYLFSDPNCGMVNALCSYSRIQASYDNIACMQWAIAQLEVCYQSDTTGCAP